MNKKITAILTAAILTCTLTACNTGSESSHSSQVQSTEQVFTLMEASTSLWLSAMEGQPQQLFTAGDKIFWSQGDPLAMIVDGYDAAAGSVLEAPFSNLHSGDPLTAVIPIDIRESDGNIIITYRSQRRDENNDWLGNTYHQDTYDASMNLVESRELFDTEDTDTSFDKFYPDGNGGWYATKYADGSEQICLLDSEFRQTGAVTSPVLYVESMYPMPDGKVYVCYREEMVGGDTYLLGVFDKETLSLSPVKPEGMPQSLRGVCSDENSLYVFDTEGIYAVDTESCTKVVDFLTANFNGSSVTSLVSMGDGSFILGVQNADYTQTELWHLEEAEPNAEVQTIVLAGSLLNSDITDAVNRYNRASSEYRIEIKDYSADGAADLGQPQFESDLLAGDLPDMIYWNGLSFEKLARKGICEDLYPYMEEEGCFTDETYFMNFFESMEYEEQLLRIGFSYDIMTLAGKTEFVGEKEGLDYTAFREMMIARPEGMDLFPDMNTSWVLFDLCVPSLSQFMDTKTVECRFDSPEFIELLRLGEGYPTLEESMEQANTMTEEELTAMNERVRYQYRNNTVLFHKDGISDPYDWHYIAEGEFGGEHVTFVGYPTSEGNGGQFNTSSMLSMVSSSEHKEEIWDFIMSMLSGSSQKNLWGLPVHRGAMEELMQRAMNDAEHDAQRSWADHERLYPIGNATQAEMDAFVSYVEGIRSFNGTDPAVLTIFWEEADMYLAGDQTAEQAAEMIQSRVSLYLSEQS